LFEGIQKEKISEWEFQAALQGVDLENKNKNTSSHSSSPPANTVDPEIPLFGDPADYQSMTMEEKKEKTTSMKNRHRAWSNRSFMEG